MGASSKPKIIAVVGPTASGKTSLGVELAKKYNGDIISADSRQIYRGMDIGTAKVPILDSRDGLVYYEGIPHYLVDIKNPDEEYTVAEFKQDATAAIEAILASGKVPIIVGGTGLYVKSVVDNLDIPTVKPDPELRERLEKDIAEHGLESVFQKLIDLDPEAAYVVDPKNPRRVVRALEVAMITGKPFTEQRRINDPLYDVLEIGINPPPEVLRARIDKRIDEMMANGLVQEVKKLLKRYEKADGELPVAFDAIGYREIIDYLKGDHGEVEAVAAMKLNTWHFAKRQITWFKKDKNIHWIENRDQAEKLIDEFLSGEIR